MYIKFEIFLTVKGIKYNVVSNLKIFYISMSESIKPSI